MTETVWMLMLLVLVVLGTVALVVALKWCVKSIDDYEDDLP